MPQLVTLEDKAALEAFLRRDTPRHLFELGDLDQRYWPYTRWYGWQDGGELRQVALLYTRPARPVLLLYGDPPFDDACAFASCLLPLLPERMYAHLGLELVDVFTRTFDMSARGDCLQMALRSPELLPERAYGDTEVLTPDDAPRLRAFYTAQDPATQLDVQMLSTLRMRGITRDGELLAVAGLHVYSRTYGVAALGGIATHAGHRRQGLGRRVTAALCRSLLEEGIPAIGLDVMTDNAGAIALYEALGFERGAVFQTCRLERP